MKKFLSVLLALTMIASLAMFAGCGETDETTTAAVGESQEEVTGGDETGAYEIAVVTDVGQLMDGGFNQGTYEGVKAYAEANGKTYQYYQPANGSDATDNDRVAAMRQAVQNGAKVIVAPGFLQATAMTTVALESPDVKFVFVDGWALADEAGNIIPNVTAIVYKEQESGYLAGYAAVKDGYTKLGGTFGGGGSNPACNRFAYGYVQGAKDAAEEIGADIEIRISFQYGGSFSASPELATQIGTWYNNGTEVVFSCGGSMIQSVISAANETEGGKIIGVDTDQSVLSDRVITSAMKGLSASVQKVLGEYYDGQWDTILGGQASNLGAADDATGLPIETSKFNTFTAEDYNAIYEKIKTGAITPDANVEGCEVADFWTALTAGHTTVVYE
ncbi:MAG: BMP family ABC transporter substrate-binding protein [Lachnospiraceae bacterium]|nr:BMP family ABC transporter substrate-binding protein [Lachnospiraceae bacterium]